MDGTNCSCKVIAYPFNCNFAAYTPGGALPLKYDSELCDYATGGVNFVGCQKWMRAFIDGDLKKNPETSVLEILPSNGDICLNENNEPYDTMSEHMENTQQIIYNADGSPEGVGKVAPDFWRMQYDPIWNIDHGLPAYPLQRQPIGAVYPYGPFPKAAFPLTPDLPDVGLDFGTLYGWDNYDEFRALRDWGRAFKTSGKADQGDYFAEVGDVFHFRLINSHLKAAGCEAKYLGFNPNEIGGCSTDTFAIDASMVPLSEAPMLRMELHQSVGPINGNICYYWRISVADGPCAGYFLDQNHEGDGAVEYHYTRWTKTPKGSDVQFHNIPGSVDFVNALNREIYGGNSIIMSLGLNGPQLYEPYYQNGWFQIPRTYFNRYYSPEQLAAMDPDQLAEFEGIDMETQRPEVGFLSSFSNYCNCEDGNCAKIQGIGFI